MKILTKLPLACAVVALVVGSSCVPNRKVTYLQYENELKEPESIVTDSLVRMYEAGEWGYLLQPNDLLSIKVASMTPEEYNPLFLADRYMVTGGAGGAGGDRQSLLNGYRIDPAGNLTLPVIGTIQASGLTLRTLEDTINSLMEKELEDPVTKVNIINFKFSVIGEVNSQNTIFSSDNALTLLQAVSMAGGASEFGDISRVKVVRWMGEEHYVFYVNLLDETFLSSEFYFIQPNDVIIITPLKARSYLKYVSPNLGIVAATISLLLSIITLVAVFQ